MAGEYRIAQLSTLASVRTWGIRKELIVSTCRYKSSKSLIKYKCEGDKISFLFSLQNNSIYSAIFEFLYNISYKQIKMSPVIQGIVWGLGLAIASFGPSFFYLINLGIQKGFKAAASFALGIAISDVVLLLVIVKGLGDVLANRTFQEIFCVVAGVAIFVVGVIYLLKKPSQLKRKSNNVPDQKSTYFLHALKGFSINVLNPFSIVLWLTVSSKVIGDNTGVFSKVDFEMFFMGLIGTILSIDVLKAYFSNWLGNVVTFRVLFFVNKGIGLLFLFFSFGLFYRFFELFF